MDFNQSKSYLYKC